ncbi:MAG: TetR/AcrR family transcriptional regulator [Oscillospiraceae bacterium]|nr:TetR/AcrR family transcriptional regulator [Oscillospiraceae bacterium]
MDRRQRKTRESIFSAFIQLLSAKEYSQITVGEIIENADIGRATFYAHFETKDFLLKELCEDLFCHIFDGEDPDHPTHRHMFHCHAPDSVFLHLFQHLLKNDNHILELLSCQNNSLFLQYFKEHLKTLVTQQLPLFEARKSDTLPESFWIDHICSTFVETLRWWVDNGMIQSPETITQYFYLAV